jgi:hypothetical protein
MACATRYDTGNNGPLSAATGEKIMISLKSLFNNKRLQSRTKFSVATEM